MNALEERPLDPVSVGLRAPKFVERYLMEWQLEFLLSVSA